MQSERFEATDLATANKECRKRKNLFKETCRACGMKVMLHCDDCKIQVTGCYCVDVDRFGEEEAKRRHAVRRADAMKRKKKPAPGDAVPGSRGLWTPHS